MNMNWLSPLVFLSGIIMGTGSTITVKIIYGIESIGMAGERQLFEKPLFATFVMFAGMTIALPVHYMVQAIKRANRKRKHYESLKSQSAQGMNGMNLHSNQHLHVYQQQDLPYQTPYAATVETSVNFMDAHDSVPWRTFFLLVIPSAFDLLGTALAGIGLLFTTVSVYQLVRCSVIIVCALLKGTVLRQKLTRYMWLGIVINTIAMVLVSSTSFFEPMDDQTYEIESSKSHSDYEAPIVAIPRDPRIGILFIIASCIVQGSQYVFEEKVMTVDNAPPLVVVGMEGLWGCLLMLLIVFPWAYILPGTDEGQCLENFWDTIVMIRNSQLIQIILVAFVITICLYNIFCIYVTFLLNSVWHAILDNFRPVAVWGTDLLLYYVFTNNTFGEKWTIYSFVELLGMIVLFIGTAIFNGSIKINQWEPDYQKFENERQQDEAGFENSSTIFSSPTPDITNSPIIRRNINKVWDENVPPLQVISKSPNSNSESTNETTSLLNGYTKDGLHSSQAKPLYGALYTNAQ